MGVFDLESRTRYVKIRLRYPATVFYIQVAVPAMSYARMLFPPYAKPQFRTEVLKLFCGEGHIEKKGQFP